MNKKRIRQTGDVRRAQIKQAVKEILFYEGMHKLTTKNIAARVGISEGTVFKHYASKRAIIDDILSDVKTELVEPLQQIALRKTGADRRLEKHICYHLEYLAQNEGITILLFTEASYQNDLELKQQLDEIFQQLKQGFIRIVEDGIAAGLWNKQVSVPDLASLYMGIPLAMNIEMLLQEETLKEYNYCKNMLDLLLRVLSK